MGLILGLTQPLALSHSTVSMWSVKLRPKTKLLTSGLGCSKYGGVSVISKSASCKHQKEIREKLAFPAN